MLCLSKLNSLFENRHIMVQYFTFKLAFVFKAVRLVGMVQAVKPNAVIVTMKKAVTRSTEHAQTDVLPVG